MAVEYSKILRWVVTPASRGVQATVTLPSAGSTKVPVYGGFVAFYVAIKFGGVSYECGLSTDFNNANADKWHWTSATSDPLEPDPLPGGTYGQYMSGQSVLIKVTLDDTVVNNKKKLKFYVGNNPDPVRTFVRDFDSTTNLTEARLVIASNNQTYATEASVPATLPPWGVLHNQVTVSNLMYKNTSNTWTAVTGANSTPPSSTEKNPANRTHQGLPLNYTMTVNPASSLIYASLKA